MLNNIAIRFNKKDFEYDVYSLVKAFYPQAQITMFYEGEEEAEGEYGMFLLVAYGSQEICLAVERDGTEIFRQQVAVEYEKDRPETKNVLKRLVYGALCQVTGRTLPWGDLTGIRPTKIPMKLLEEGWKTHLLLLVSPSSPAVFSYFATALLPDKEPGGKPALMDVFFCVFLFSCFSSGISADRYILHRHM